MKEEQPFASKNEDLPQPPKWVEHHLWYLLIGFVILGSSIVLCYLIYKIHFLDGFKELIPNATDSNPDSNFRGILCHDHRLAWRNLIRKGKGNAV